MVGEPGIHGQQEVIQVADQPTRLLWEWWITALITTIAAIALTCSQSTRSLDSLLLDTLQYPGAPDPDPGILIVAFDNESLNKIGPWPWPRAVHARLLNTLEAMRPRAIGYDVLFAESTPHDAELSSALGGAAPVFLPVGFEVPGQGGRPFDLVRPPTNIAGAAAGLGHVNLIADSDGIVRRVRLWDGAGMIRIPQLMLGLYQAVSSNDAPGDAATRSSDPRIIPFAGTAGRYPSISAAAVLRGELPPEIVKDRILLVGATAIGLNDWHPTSIRGSNGTISGVELQANLLDGLLHNRLIRDATLFEQLAVSLLAPWLLLIAFRWFLPRALLLTLILIVSLDLLLSGSTLWVSHVWLSPVTGILLALMLYPLWGWRRLSAVNSFMVSELEQLQARNRGPVLPARAARNVDPISRQLILLRKTAADMREVQNQRESLLQFLTHDMRAPQSSIVAAVRTAAANDISPPLAARIEGYARRTLELADGFVLLARADTASYLAEPIDFAGIVLDAIDDIWPLLQEKNLICRAKNDTEQELLVVGDGSLLFRVIVNILHNAIRFSPPSSEIICDMSIDARGGIDVVVCAISDDGPGVPPEKQPSMFGRFASREISRRSQPSAGLGLAFAATVVARHGGQIWYEAAPKTTFSVALPHACPSAPS